MGKCSEVRTNIYQISIYTCQHTHDQNQTYANKSRHTYVHNVCQLLNPDIAIYADDTTLYSKYDQASDLWKQLQFASELESDLRDTVDWGKKWLVDFNTGKTQLVSFDQSNKQWFY